MRSPQGYAQILDPERPLREYDTATCCHCGKIIFIKPGTVATVYLIPLHHGGFREEPGAGCRLCLKPVCLSCEALGSCTPLERKLEQAEQSARLFRALG